MAVMANGDNNLHKESCHSPIFFLAETSKSNLINTSFSFMRQYLIKKWKEEIIW